MKTALIGSTGFVGGNLLAQQSPQTFEFAYQYNSKNIASIAGETFDVVVCAGAPAAMWVANQDPEADWAALRKLMQPLEKVSANHFVLISTIAVYPRPIGVDEDAQIDLDACTPYGKHRCLLERFVAERFETTIVRLPGLFGLGLKKNIIFDFLHSNNLAMINAKSVYQFYDLNNLTSDIFAARERKISLLNISSAPTSTAEVATHCFGIDFTNVPAGPPAQFDYRSRYASLWSGRDGYLYSKEQVLNSLKSFVQRQQAL